MVSLPGTRIGPGVDGEGSRGISEKGAASQAAPFLFEGEDLVGQVVSKLNGFAGRRT
jgi:hypothetical protein